MAKKSLTIKFSNDHTYTNTKTWTGVEIKLISLSAHFELLIKGVLRNSLHFSKKNKKLY